jgi:TonB family protein
LVALRRCFHLWGICAVLWPTALMAQVEGARREMVDAGVHVPTLTRPPELRQFVEAVYPEDAQAQGLTGEVKLRLTLGDTGSVVDAEVMEPAGHGFDEAALTAVRQFQFTPAEVDGRPASVQLDYVYKFVLREAPPSVDAGPPAPAEATLTGEVIARGSRNRVDAVTLRCANHPDAPEAVTDAQGRFRLTVAPGECELKAVATGYELFQTKETLAPGETTEVVYYLLPKAIGYETVIRGQRDKKEVVRRSLDRQELQKVPGSLGDPVRVLQNFPGVARAPFISGQLIVRGASPDQTLTYMDGVEIPLLYHLGGGPSVVNAEFLDRIDFYPGGFGARYGRAVGGTVDVGTRKGATDTFHGVGKVDLLDASAFVEAPLGERVSIAAAARRSYVDALIPLVLPADPEGGALLVLPVYWDYQVRVDVGGKRGEKKDAGSTYYAMAFGSDDVLKIVASGGGRNRDVSLDVHTVFHRAKGDWTYRQGRFQSVFTPYVGYDLTKADFGTSKIRADEYSLGLREDLTYEWLPWLTLRGGTDTLYQVVKGAAEFPVLSGQQFPAFPGAEPAIEAQDISRTIHSFDGALYVEADFKAGPVTLTPGLRASYSRIYERELKSYEPRLWVRYKAAENTTLKGSLGMYTQPPEFSDLEPEPLGNPNLRHERAVQASLGVEQRLFENVNLDVTGFFNRRYDNIVSPGRVLNNEDGSVTRERLSNDGLGRAYGLEVLLRHEVTDKFFGWLAYTLNRSEQNRAGLDEPEPYRLSSNDQTHILTAVGSYRLPYGFELGARFRFVTGRPKTPVTHDYDVYSSDANRFYPTQGAILSSRLAPFHQLDVRVDKSFLFKHWTLTLYLDVQNAYNAKNVEATFYDYRFREEIAVPGIPLLPVLGVKGSF